MLHTIGFSFFKIKVWTSLGDMMVYIMGLENVYQYIFSSLIYITPLAKWRL